MVKVSGFSTKLTYSKSKSDRKSQTCGRCNVHGLKMILAGHKNYCKYRNCDCRKCYVYLTERKRAADKTAMKRQSDLSKKKVLNDKEVQRPPSCCTYKESGIQKLLVYTRNEMYRSVTVCYDPIKIDRIFSILINYCRDVDMTIEFNGFLKSATKWIGEASIIRHSKIIHQDMVQNSFMKNHAIIFRISWEQLYARNNLLEDHYSIHSSIWIIHLKLCQLGLLISYQYQRQIRLLKTYLNLLMNHLLNLLSFLLLIILLTFLLNLLHIIDRLLTSNQ